MTNTPRPARPDRGLAALARHRGYILRAAWADVRDRHAGSAAGVLWTVIQPLALIAVFSIVFTRIVTREAGDIPGGYAVYLCAALLAWNGLADGLTRGARAFVSQAHYLRKLPVPEEVFVAQVAVSAGIGLFISYALFLPIAAILGQTVTWHWLIVPAPLALLLAMVFGASLALAAANAFVRDTATVVQVLLPIGFWAYPIAYHAEFLSPTLRALSAWHPAAPYLSGLRDLIVHARLPATADWFAMAGWAAGACLAGRLVLGRLRPEIRDVL